jgi:hypothetical protein
MGRVDADLMHMQCAMWKAFIVMSYGYIYKCARRSDFCEPLTRRRFSMGIAPVWIGEFGTSHDQGGVSNGWFQCMLEILSAPESGATECFVCRTGRLIHVRRLGLELLGH